MLLQTKIKLQCQKKQQFTEKDENIWSLCVPNESVVLHTQQRETSYAKPENK